MISIWWYIVIGLALVHLVFLTSAKYREYFLGIKLGKNLLDTLSRNWVTNCLLLILGILISIIIYSFLPIIYLLFYRDIQETEREISPKESNSEKITNHFDGLNEQLRRSIADHLLFDKETFPFDPDCNQVIYIENEKNDVYNNYIQTHYDEIKSLFNKDGFAFCYLPFLAKEVSAKEIISYRFPQINDNQCEFPQVDSSILLPYIKGQPTIRPSLIHYDIDPINKKPYFEFTRFEFASDNEVTIEQQFEWYHHILVNSRFHLSGIDTEELSKQNLSHLPDKVREEFERIIEDYETKKLIGEVLERVTKLHQMGVSEMVLNLLFHPENKLSRLVITNNYRIMLPDYKDMEITMTPLPKAVFFLFLRHPEGILFKQLIEYRDELCHIYNKISNRTIKENIEQSISDVTDPTNNSINEKCARIREAFISKFDERLACNYFVTGSRGELKKIVLPRDMVTWEVEF